jgi:hypothetical protein
MWRLCQLDLFTSNLLEKKFFEGALSEGIVIIQHQEAAIQGLSTVLYNATTNRIMQEVNLHQYCDSHMRIVTTKLMFKWRHITIKP